MSLHPQRFADHLRAAYGAESLVVPKGDEYYARTIATLDVAARQKLIRELRDCGFEMEFSRGPLLGGDVIRLKCADPVKAKSFIESMNAVEDKRDAEIAALAACVFVIPRSSAHFVKASKTCESKSIPNFFLATSPMIPTLYAFSTYMNG